MVGSRSAKPTASHRSFSECRGRNEFKCRIHRRSRDRARGRLGTRNSCRPPGSRFNRWQGCGYWCMRGAGVRNESGSLCRVFAWSVLGYLAAEPSRDFLSVGGERWGPVPHRNPSTSSKSGRPPAPTIPTPSSAPRATALKGTSPTAAPTATPSISRTNLPLPPRPRR